MNENEARWVRDTLKEHQGGTIESGDLRMAATASDSELQVGATANSIYLLATLAGEGYGYFEKDSIATSSKHRLEVNKIPPLDLLQRIDYDEFPDNPTSSNIKNYSEEGLQRSEGPLPDKLIR